MRLLLSDKNKKDTDICRNFLSSEIYKNADRVLCYASLKDEICTDLILNSAFEDSKAVALPKCMDTCGNMIFYYVKSFDDIESGAFGIKEPKADVCAQVRNFSCSVCVVPALAYDVRGFRLGYGKGYYDRFLQKFNSISVGLCYNEFLRESLPADEHDVSVNFVFTENKIIEV